MDNYRIESTIKSLTTGYLIALLFITAIAWTTHVITLRVIESQSTNSAVVNISGRQRMLSQRIAMLAEHFVTHGTEKDKAQLSSTVSLFERSHQNLIDGVFTGGEVPLSVNKIYFSEPLTLDSNVTRFVDTARKIISSPNNAPEEIEALVFMARGDIEETGTLLNGLNTVVQEYQSLHEKQIGKMLLFQHTSLAALFITIALEALIIFYPLLRNVKSLTQDLKKAALTDPLTDVNNRRGFQGAMEVAIEQSDNSALMILDIDHFKSVNDKFGHAAGDLCIQHLVNLTNRYLKQGDVIGRIGGEEFAILLSDTSLPAAIATAEELRLEVQNTPCELESAGCEAERVSITVSIGLVPLTSKSVLTDSLQQADKLLYQAKNSGRNQVVLTEATTPFQRAA